MKKIYIAMLAVMCAMAVSACSDKEKETASESSASTAVDSVSGDTSETEEETQPDPLDPNRATEALTEAATEQDEADGGEEATEENTVEEATLPAEEIPTDENGAVVIGPGAELTDEELIAAAQQFYGNACRVNWNYHVGCPYSLDYESSIQNDLGWEYFLVTSEGINSLADVEADYFKVFSEKYGSDLSELYMEKDGRVYAFDGARGMDIYYKGSQITSIKNKTEGELFFEVEHTYSGSDFGGEGEYTETGYFSVVISEDGSWRAGQFTLPY